MRFMLARAVNGPVSPRHCKGHRAGFMAALTLACVVSVSVSVSVSHADTGGDIGAHDSIAPARYGLEIEPHIIGGTLPPGFGQGSGIGAGVRGSIVILRNGIIPHVNDSIALGLGLDYGRYKGDWALNGWRDQCLTHVVAPDGTEVCSQVTSNGGTYDYLYIPVVVQWSFWPAQRFSAFVEPGADLYYLGHHGFGVVPALYLGARVRLSHRVSLTGRIGYPTLALGASFML